MRSGERLRNAVEAADLPRLGEILGAKPPEDLPPLLLVAADGGARVRAYLHRHVFPDLLRTEPVFDALYVAVTLSDDATRAGHLERVRAALAAKDDAELRRLGAGLDVPIPAGHTLVREHIGTGKTSRVSLVRRDTDGCLLAWKIPSDDSAVTRGHAVASVERSLEWARLGISEAPVEWADDGVTLLQPFVDGETLSDAMRASSFLTDRADPRHAALIEFLRKVVVARTFVSGLNADNMVHDGERWQVIDSGSVQPQPTEARTWLRQRRACQDKWTRAGLAKHAEPVRTFLDVAERDLGVSRVALVLARLRRRG
jgi:hypothetical protein